MHKSMSLLDRLENALCGFVLMDLFKLLSTRECKRRGLPANSLWMASQTHRNLQYVVMGFVSAVLGKDRVGDPWKNSHLRWTELPIEMWFGRLRQRATSAQFNAKQYWSHAAAEMMRTKKLGVGESDSSILQPPTEEEFYTASQRALNSALKLAAWAAEVSEETLLAAYAESAPNMIPAYDANETLHPWERDPKEDWESEDAAADPEENAEKRWQELLKHVRDEAAASLEASEQPEGHDQKRSEENENHEEENTEENTEKNADRNEEKIEEPAAMDEFHAVLGMPDGLDLKDLCQDTEMDAGDAMADGSSQLLCTLREALRATSDSSSIECFDKLWRLVMYLRHWFGGMDQQWVRNPRAARKKAATKHWYRCLGSLEKQGVVYL